MMETELDLDDEVRAAVQRAYIAGYTDALNETELPVEWELEVVEVDEWMGDLLVAALCVTEKPVSEQSATHRPQLTYTIPDHEPEEDE